MRTAISMTTRKTGNENQVLTNNNCDQKLLSFFLKPIKTKSKWRQIKLKRKKTNLYLNRKKTYIFLNANFQIH